MYNVHVFHLMTHMFNNSFLMLQDAAIEATFSDHSHVGSIRALAVSPSGILASGSTDETIRLFNLRKRVEFGNLMHHKGKN